MELKIYDKQGNVKMTVSPDNSSQWNHEVGVENVVTVNFTTWEFLVLEVGCYIWVEGHRFSIKSEYRPKHIHNSKYTYNLKFYGREHDTQDILFCRLNQGEDDLESVFAYDGTPMDFLNKVVANMNRNSDGIVWKAGEAITGNRQTINFNGLYCWDALGEIARTFGTEWWMDGEYLNLSKCIRGETVRLGYGEGLKAGLSQNENTNAVKWFTRLIPVGSTKNIDKSKYGYANLQLPGREKYIDINTQYGLKEYREEAAFSDIYPHRKGTISNVREETRINEDTGTYYVYFVRDASIPFNPNDYMLAGEVIHLTFNTGVLAGKEFEVNWNNTSKEFEIINQYPDEKTQLPGGNLIPSNGDTYVLSNISMPDEYNTAAEQEFQEAVDAYLEEYSRDISIYSGSTDYVYIEQNNVPLQLGQRIRLVSDQYFSVGARDSRITRVSRKLNNHGEATIDCSDAVTLSWIGKLQSSINNVSIKQNSIQNQTNKIEKEVSNLSSISEYWKLKKDKNDKPYLFSYLPVVTQYGITMYADNGSLDIPSIYAGLPIDNSTLVWKEGVLMINPNLDLGGGASSWDELEGIPSWIGATKPTYEYSEIQNTPDLSKYVSSDDLSKYVTLGTEQTITGKKDFTTGGLFVNGKQIQYDATNGCWKLEGNLLVTGGVTMYADGTTSGGSSAYSTLGSLLNVDDSIDASASVDRVLFQAAGSSEWVTKPLSEIGGSVSGDYLPLSGGILSGTLYLNNNVSISSYVDNVAYDIFRLNENNHLLVGYGHAPNGNTSIYGNNVYLRNGAARGYALTALANGNVGIGTTNPDYKLHVVGESLLSQSANGNLYYRIKGVNYELAFGLESGGVNRGIYDFTNASWLIYRDSSTNVFIPQGNVGIGTTNPSFKLHVVGTGYFSNGINYSTASSSFNSVGIKFATDLARISVSSSGDMGIYATGIVSIRGNSQSGSSGTGLTIEGSGNASLTGKLTLAGTDYTTAILEFSRDNFNYILFPNTLSIGKSTAGADRLLVLNSTDATFQCNILPSAKYTYNLGAYGTYFKQIHANEHYSGAAGNGLWLIGGNSADTTGVVIARNSSADTTGAEICRFNANGLVWASEVSGNICTTNTNIYLRRAMMDTNTLLLGYEYFSPLSNSTDLIKLGRYNARWKGVYLGISTSAYNNENGVTFCDSSGNGVSRISQATNMGIISSGAIYLRPASTKGASGTITASSIGATIDTSGNMLVTGGITMYSDQRKKTILNHVELSLKQIADAPLIEHYYNSDQEKTTHVGSIAQYWAELNDWFCKKDEEGFYTMEIQNAALASAISIARHLERYETKTDKKIRQLKKRISQLEDELKLLKKGA